MTFHPLEKTEHLVDGYQRVFDVAGRKILLLQHNGEVHALEGVCPHAGYPLAEAKLIGDELRCPMHGYRFDISSGTCTFSTEGPCRAIETYAVIVDEDRVGVEF